MRKRLLEGAFTNFGVVGDDGTDTLSRLSVTLAFGRARPDSQSAPPLPDIMQVNLWPQRSKR